MKIIAMLVLAALSPGICQADIYDVGALYRTILAQPDSAHVPGPMEIDQTATEAALRAAPPEQIREVLPLAAKCLDSSDAAVRAAGMHLLFDVALVRPDNASMLSPYFDRIAAFLTDSDMGMKQGAISILAAGFPSPAPQALAILAAHLNDDQNSVGQFNMISGALLIGFPSDAGMVQKVLAALHRRPDREILTGDMLVALGREKIATGESLQFIRSALSSDKDYIRLSAVEAIGKMPRNVRDGFTADLHQLLANNAESAEVTARAKYVLTQVQ
jgi:hypothetical protein